MFQSRAIACFKLIDLDLENLEEELCVEPGDDEELYSYDFEHDGDAPEDLIEIVKKELKGKTFSIPLDSPVVKWDLYKSTSYAEGRKERDYYIVAYQLIPVPLSTQVEYARAGWPRASYFDKDGYLLVIEKNYEIEDAIRICLQPDGKELMRSSKHQIWLKKEHVKFLVSYLNHFEKNGWNFD